MLERDKESERPISATPEIEDFRGKYESGRIGQVLLDRYFRSISELLDRIDAPEAQHAIEIGCGEGLSTMRLRPLIPRRISLQASEYVNDQVILARENNPTLTVTHESIYELSHGSDAFDVVFLLEVLEHLDYPGPALREVARVLKPGGYLIAGVPREPLWRVLNMARGKYVGSLGNTPGHLNHWSKVGFKRYIGQSFGEVIATRSPIPWTLVLTQNRDGRSD
jgi:SAM-dependent methyltransferase